MTEVMDASDVKALAAHYRQQAMDTVGCRKAENAAIEALYQRLDPLEGTNGEWGDLRVEWIGNQNGEDDDTSWDVIEACWRREDGQSDRFAFCVGAAHDHRGLVYGLCFKDDTEGEWITDADEVVRRVAYYVAAQS